MGLFESLFGRRETNPSLLAGGSAWKDLTTYQPTFRTYHERIYESDLVRAAIDARARNISKLKVEFAGSAKGSLKSAVRSAPNSWMTWSQFLYRLSVILDMQNTAFIIPVFDKYGVHKGYYPLLPSNCKLMEYKGVVYLQYTFKNNQTAAIEFESVGILTKHQYESDFFGESNKALVEKLSLENLNSQGTKEYIKTSAVYRFMAQVLNFAKAEDLKKERQRFTDLNLKDEDGNGGLMLFPNTYQNIKQVEPKNYILDQERVEYIKKSVFDYFGVNDDIIQNKANSEVYESFYEGAIEPFAVQLSQVMTKMTFTQVEIANGNEIAVTSNRLLRMSPQEKINYISAMADRGLMTINEIRVDLLNLSRVDGGDVFPRRGEYYFGDLETINSTTGEDENE